MNVNPTAPPPSLPNDDPLPCQTTDPEVFFPEYGGANSVESRRLAVALCASCPLLTECREWALDNQSHGYAGGMSEIQRRKENRRRAGAARDDEAGAA